MLCYVYATCICHFSGERCSALLLVFTSRVQASIASSDVFSQLSFVSSRLIPGESARERSALLMPMGRTRALFFDVFPRESFAAGKASRSTGRPRCIRRPYVQRETGVCRRSFNRTDGVVHSHARRPVQATLHLYLLLGVHTHSCKGKPQHAWFRLFNY